MLAPQNWPLLLLALAALVTTGPDFAEAARVGRLAGAACGSNNCSSQWLGYLMLAMGAFCVLSPSHRGLWKSLNRTRSGEVEKPNLFLKFAWYATGIVFSVFGGQLVGWHQIIR